MQVRYLCFPPTFSLVLCWLPHFFNSRIATALEQEPHTWKPWALELEPCSWKKAQEPKLYHFYDGSAALRLEASKLETSCSRVIATNKSFSVKGGLGCFGTSVLKREISIAAVPALSWQFIAKSAIDANDISFLYFSHKISSFPCLI